jgi:hypothetical protein
MTSLLGAALYNTSLYNETLYNEAVPAEIVPADHAVYRVALGDVPQTFERIFAEAARRDNEKQVE